MLQYIMPSPTVHNDGHIAVAAHKIWKPMSKVADSVGRVAGDAYNTVSDGITSVVPERVSRTTHHALKGIRGTFGYYRGGKRKSCRKSRKSRKSRKVHRKL
jgi:hypothetical protein